MTSYLALVFLLCGVLHYSTAEIGDLADIAAKSAMKNPIVAQVPGAQCGIGGAMATMKAFNKYQETGDYRQALRTGGDSIAESANDMADSNPTLGMLRTGTKLANDIRDGKDFKSALTESASEMAQSNSAFKMFEDGNNLVRDLTGKDLSKVITERAGAEMSRQFPGAGAGVGAGAVMAKDFLNKSNMQTDNSKRNPTSVRNYLRRVGKMIKPTTIFNRLSKMCRSSKNPSKTGIKTI